MKKLVIIGHGDQGEIVKYLVMKSKKYHLLGFIDDEKKTDCLGRITDIPLLINKAGNFTVFIAIANNLVRSKIYLKLKKMDINCINIIHPCSIIEENVVLGNNVFIGANTIININSKIDDGVYINTGCIIEHDNSIGSFSHLAPRVVTGGGVKIGDNSFIGLGSCLRNHINLGKNTFVAMGSIVTHSYLQDNLALRGNPAKIFHSKKEIRNIYQ
ncbi:hypothetical protein A3C23_00825 [Candidatus Roizmanbacteria bacterium RIFCSPHIGHO2_02_FULL_37_13b]|uniref:PglD N-terminal domain-containing protein n=1 Tax=Candidatus Roizmanbacteria bacterium RIFCSPLOWO2_02_FULL_36_11 TaxID=1802071 RepID=A0A1F7JIW7_9BACT|nr:MAG: hypothetical protein A3C23_00825 [Candidatus Roizmanbacteria bacterium RIFCSPHIGHO2_02_FULL_37_13b]OGK55562.1 MAG: hypothetical protein A3H78_05360 [Candidatus Roizmanbacteria bacterium RIFCSPLOWO2_02_FULL_36_11]